MDAEEEERQRERRELADWRRLRTGGRSDYNSIRRDHRGFPIFVRATRLSKCGNEGEDTDGVQSVADPEDNGSNLDDSLDDIFSASARPTERQASNGLQKAVSSHDGREEGRGKAVASFYSQLPRESPDTELRPRQETVYSMRKTSHHTHKPSHVDWFIRKASAQLQTEEQKEDKERRTWTPPVDGEASSGLCKVCASHLSFPLSASQWEAHRLSIAHQLALDGPSGAQDTASSSCQSGRKRKAGEEDEEQRVGRILLKASNLGYAALERMGWRRGMGLGREEWEHGRRSRGKEGEGKQGWEDAIAISDSDDGEELELGTQGWLNHIAEQEQARLPVSRPETLAEQKDEEDAKEPAPSHPRPLLEPIAVHLRPDRRGIGNALPRRSHPAANAAERKREPSRREGMTKRERKEREGREREEWKELRKSLN